MHRGRPRPCRRRCWACPRTGSPRAALLWAPAAYVGGVAWRCLSQQRFELLQARDLPELPARLACGARCVGAAWGRGICKHEVLRCGWARDLGVCFGGGIVMLRQRVWKGANQHCHMHVTRARQAPTHAVQSAVLCADWGGCRGLHAWAEAGSDRTAWHSVPRERACPVTAKATIGMEERSWSPHG